MNDPLFWLTLVFWLFGIWLLYRIPVPGKPKASDASIHSLSVIIPARNEANTLGDLLDSLANQRTAPLETIVVDDQSEDETAAIAAEFGCRTILSPKPPRGWTGKPWACMQGARAAKGDRLLFLDADTVLTKDGLERLVSGFPHSGRILTVQPYHLMKRRYERLSAVFNIIVMAGSNAFTPLGSKLKPMGAFGPCLLCSKKDYFAVGGHEKVRGEILENVALGKVFLNAGFSMACFGGKGVLWFRMYGDGFRSMVEGFIKSFGTGAKVIPRTNLVMSVCWVFGSVSLARNMIESAFVGNDVFFAVWGGLYLLYAIQFYWMLYRIGNFGTWPCLLFPVPVLFFVSVFFLSLFKTVFLAKVRWKGRLVNTTKGRTPDP